MARVLLLSVLSLLLTATAHADVLRLTTTDELNYKWDRGRHVVRKISTVVLTADDRLRHVVRFRDEHHDAVSRSVRELSPRELQRLRALIAAAELSELEGESIGHLMQTHPRFELALEHPRGVTRVRGSGFGDHAGTVGVLVDALLALALPAATTVDPASGQLRLTLTRHTAAVKRGEGEDPATYQLTKRLRIVRDASRLRVRACFEDSRGDTAHSERDIPLSASERAELDARLAAARLSDLDGVVTSNVFAPDTPTYELALARPDADEVVVRGEGYGRHEDRLEPLVGVLLYLARRGPDPAPRGDGVTEVVDRLGD